MNTFPRYGEQYLKYVQVFLPLILVGLDFIYLWIIEHAFSNHIKNYDGQAMLLGMYIWHMEAMRFDCFLSLYLGWKHKNVPFTDVFSNAICSIVSEIWIYTGIGEQVKTWLDIKISCLNLKSDFPDMEKSFCSVRAILE